MRYRHVVLHITWCTALATQGMAQQEPPSTLRSRIGVQVGERGLSSNEPAEREQALERLGTTGTPRALGLLSKALDPAGAAVTARQRLTAVRALALSASHPTARQALARAMAALGSRATDERAEPLDALARATAGLALARSGNKDALVALGKALKNLGLGADAARSALLAYPPRELAPVLAAPGPPTVALARTLGELGDQRAFFALREMVQRGAPEVRAEAAVALTLLGDYETVELARHWLRQPREPHLHVAAARILALSRAEDSAASITRLFGDESTEPDALALALNTPDARLVEPIARRIAAASRDRAPAFITAIGRAGGPHAARVLASLLKDERLRGSAAYALARLPGAEARDALEAALATPALRRVAVRAAVVRLCALGERLDGLEEVAERLAASASPADRAAGARVLVTLDAGLLPAFLEKTDGAVIHAAAPALLTANEAALGLATKKLVASEDPEQRSALAIALATPFGASNVPTRTLLELIEMGGPAAALASKVLASRDEQPQRPLVSRLLASDDPWIRAHVALGLATSSEPSATGLLAGAYAFEADPLVRRAIVLSLATRPPSGARRRSLELAAALDPDAGARGSARLALRQPIEAPAPAGRATLWLELEPSGAEPAEATGGRAIGVRIGSGLVLPMVTDPDGFLVATGLSAGPVDVRVAAAKKGLQAF